MEKTFNSEELSWLQENKSLYVKFLFNYITWICQTYPQLVRRIGDWKSVLKPLEVELYLLFLKQRHSFNESVSNRIRTQLMSSVNNCIAVTLDLVKTEDSAQNMCYIEIILNEFCLPGNKSIAASYTAYQQARKRDKNTIKETKFFREGDCYCITGDDLLNLYSTCSNFPYHISKKAISKQHVFHGMLKIKGDGNSFPANQRSGKVRYYHLYVNRIIDLLQERMADKYIFFRDGHPLATVTFNRRLKKCCEELGIEYRSSPKIRFTTASIMYKNGINETELSPLLGHTTLNMTRHYLRNIAPAEETAEKMRQILQ